MKIAQIVCTYPPARNGLGLSVFHFSDHLARLGHEVTVITTPAKNRPDNFVFNHKIFRPRPLLRFGHAALLPLSAARLAAFDAVHLHYPFFGTAEWLAWAPVFSRARFRLFIHYHMDTPGLQGLAAWAGAAAKFCQKKLFSSAQGITCASLDYIAHSRLADLYRVRPELFREVPFGVDGQQFFFQAKGASTGEILFVGALDQAHYFKGLPVLLSALVRLPGVRLTAAGDGECRSDYEKTAARLGVSDRVRFTVAVSAQRLVSLYQGADVLVLPSINRHEAFGLVLLEAMSTGTPVVATDLPGVRRVFHSGREGFLARPNDPNDLAEKIGLILNDPALRDACGRRARALTESKYDWEISARRLEKIYQNGQI